MKKADLVSSLFLLVLGLVMIFIIIPAQTSPGEGFGVPPATVPTAAMALIAGLAALHLVKTLRRPDDGRPNPLNGRALLHLALYTGVLFLGLAALKYLHFIPGGILIVAGLMLLTGQRNWWLLGLLSAAAPILVYAALWYGLRIPLP